MVSELKNCIDEALETLSKRRIPLNRRLLHKEYGNKNALDDIINGNLEHKTLHPKVVIEYIAELLGGSEAIAFRDKARIAHNNDIDNIYLHKKMEMSERADGTCKEIGAKDILNELLFPESSKDKIAKDATGTAPLVPKNIKGSLTNAFDKKGELFIKRRHAVILDLLRNNKKMTIRELSETLNATQPGIKCSTATIARDLKFLESAGLLKRVGGRSDSGHWKVILASLSSGKSKG
jgi:DNA-binding HxlR family transcriptional regulator